MKQANKTQKGKKPSNQGPVKPQKPQKPQDVIELTDQDLEQVQGGAAPAGLGPADFAS